MNFPRIYVTVLGWSLLITAAVQILSAEKPQEKYTLKSFAPTSDFYERPFGLLSYNGITKTARWTLERIDKNTKSGDRTGLSFHIDPDVPSEFAASPEDYRGSNLDAGHLPCARNHGDDVKATFSIADVAPEYPELNRGVWNKGEGYLFDFAHRLGVKEIWILTAVAWLPEHGMLHTQVIGKNAVWVPTHFEKTACVVFNDGSIELLAWKFTNCKEPEAFEDGRITVDQFEHDTGLDAWRSLPEPLQSQLEAKK